MNHYTAVCIDYVWPLQPTKVELNIRSRPSVVHEVSNPEIARTLVSSTNPVAFPQTRNA